MIADNGKDTCERYRRDISCFERIAEKREAALSRTIQKRRSARKVEAAVRELVESNLFLVLHCVKDFDSFLSSPSVRLARMDLIAEGNIALMTAAQHYNVDYSPGLKSGKPVRFAAYACGIIRNRMRRAIKMARLIHIPEQHFSYWSRMKNIESHYGEALTDEIMMEELGVEKSKLKKLNESLDLDVSGLEELACTEGNSRWADILADESAISPQAETELSDMNDYLSGKLAKLPGRTRAMIVSMYLSSDRASLGDLSRQYGVSRERCRQIVSKGLLTLRRQLESRHSGLGIEKMAGSRSLLSQRERAMPARSAA